jgi:hypothetical protein
MKDSFLNDSPDLQLSSQDFSDYKIARKINTDPAGVNTRFKTAALTV